MKVDGDWGCGDGSGCGLANTKKWGPNSIYNIECKKCGTKIEFFKDDKKRSCSHCGDQILNPHFGTDCC